MHLSKALASVQNERQRQITKSGYSFLHDDKHSNGELVYAAIAYALSPCDIEIQENDKSDFLCYNFWPFIEPIKKGTERDNLVKAAALLIAEIERIDRAEDSEPKYEAK